MSPKALKGVMWANGTHRNGNPGGTRPMNKTIQNGTPPEQSRIHLHMYETESGNARRGIYCLSSPPQACWGSTQWVLELLGDAGGRKGGGGGGIARGCCLSLFCFIAIFCM